MLTPSFIVTQRIGLPSVLYFEDTSTGSDTISERRIYLQKQDGTYLTPAGSETDYIVWPYADTTFTLDILDKDYALSIAVDWVSDQEFVLINNSDFLLINSTDKLTL